MTKWLRLVKKHLRARPHYGPKAMCPPSAQTHRFIIYIPHLPARVNPAGPKSRLLSHFSAESDMASGLWAQYAHLRVNWIYCRRTPGFTRWAVAGTCSGKCSVWDTLEYSHLAPISHGRTLSPVVADLHRRRTRSAWCAMMGSAESLNFSTTGFSCFTSCVHIAESAHTLRLTVSASYGKVS